MLRASLMARASPLRHIVGIAIGIGLIAFNRLWLQWEDDLVTTDLQRTAFWGCSLVLHVGGFLFAIWGILNLIGLLVSYISYGNNLEKLNRVNLAPLGGY